MLLVSKLWRFLDEDMVAMAIVMPVSNMNIAEKKEHLKLLSNNFVEFLTLKYP
jgi:hypothetical protein